MKTKTRQLATTVFIFLAITIGASHLYASQSTSSNALQGVNATKAIFDINFGDPKKLELYLDVIERTHSGLLQQGHHPDFIIAFRGSSVRLITNETWSFSEEDQLRLQKGAALLKKLSEQGVQLEACTIATDLFKIDNNSLLSAVKPVGNTFISLIGYQSQGYSLIPIQ